MANTLGAFRNGAVGFIEWLDRSLAPTIDIASPRVYSAVRVLQTNSASVTIIIVSSFIGLGADSMQACSNKRMKAFRLPGRQILVDLSILHYDEKVLGGVFDQLDVF